MLVLGGYMYGEKCVFVVNDWYVLLVFVLLVLKYRWYGVYVNLWCILVIYNLVY